MRIIPSLREPPDSVFSTLGTVWSTLLPFARSVKRFSAFARDSESTALTICAVKRRDFLTGSALALLGKRPREYLAAWQASAEPCA